MSSAFVEMKKPMLSVPCIVHNESSSQQQNQQSNDVNCVFLLFFLCLDPAQEAKTVYIPINAAPQPPLLPLLPKKHSRLSLTKAVERFISALPMGKKEEVLLQCVEERRSFFSSVWFEWCARSPCTSYPPASSDTKYRASSTSRHREVELHKI